MILYAAKDLGALVRDRRRHLGITQQDLADKVGVSRVWVVAMEKGKPSARMGLVLQTLKQLGVALHAEVDDAVIPAAGINLSEIVDQPTRNSTP